MAKRTKGQTISYKAPYGKLKIEKLMRNSLKNGVHSRASER